MPCFLPDSAPCCASGLDPMACCDVMWCPPPAEHLEMIESQALEMMKHNERLEKRMAALEQHTQVCTLQTSGSREGRVCCIWAVMSCTYCWFVLCHTSSCCVQRNTCQCHPSRLNQCRSFHGCVCAPAAHACTFPSYMQQRSKISEQPVLTADCCSVVRVAVLLPPRTMMMTSCRHWLRAWCSLLMRT